MHRKLRRRDFLGTAAAAVLLGTHSKGHENNDGGKSAQHEVRLEYLRPKELKDAQAACPAMFS